MSQDNNRKKIQNSIVSIIIIISILFAGYVYADISSFYIIQQGLTSTTTEYNLDCHIRFNETTIVNITWYNGTSEYLTQNDTDCNATQDCFASIPSINKDYTSKKETWTCSATFENNSILTVSNLSIYIADSPPSVPNVTLGSISIYNNSVVNITEDFQSIFNINSIDIDGDTVNYVYFPGNIPAFCTVNNMTGVMACNGTAESDIGLHGSEILARSGDPPLFSAIVFIINVTPTNDPPYFSPALSSKNITEGYPLNLTLIAADDEDNTPISFTLISDLSSLILVNITNNTAQLMFNNSGQNIATFSDRGNHSISINIIDSGIPAKNYTGAFNLEVIPNNHAPIVSVIVYNNASLNQTGDLSIYINATDIDNDTLTLTTNISSLYNISSGPTDHSDNAYSFAAGWINITAMDNSYVTYRNFNIIVFDSKQNATATIFLNITNTNDPPYIYEISQNSNNSLYNTNLSNITGYTGVPLIFYVNATDPDMLTYEGEILNYTTNDSIYGINISTGILHFTPLSEGNFTFIVNVTDDQGLSFIRNASVHVNLNTNPYFTNQNISLQCYEYDASNYDHNCFHNLSLDVNDSDLLDHVAIYWTNATFFTINNATGIISFAPNQSVIGNYTIEVNITDTRGGMNSTTIQIIINNTNNVPQINNTVMIPPERLRIGTGYEIRVYGYDQDLDLPNSYENITFNLTTIGPNSTLFVIEKLTATEAKISFTPTIPSDAGNYTLNVTAKDAFGNISSVKQIILFIYNNTVAPNITQITPYGTPLISTVATLWANTSLFPNKITDITIDENSTYVFSQNTVADNASYSNNLNYTWMFDGSSVDHNSSYSPIFDFFSSGTHTMILYVEDQFNYRDNFSWYITINNVNRPPRLVHLLDNLTVNGTTTYNNYLVYYNGLTRFIDDDDDLDHDGKTIGNESSLKFTTTNCTSARFTVIDTDFKVRTNSIGECYINITAIDSLDSSMTVTDYMVHINVTEVSNDTTEIITPTPSNAGGGGGSSTRTVTLPLPLDVEKPKPLQLITPKLITIYKNATIKVPIIINNTWNDSLRGLTLSAYTNATNVTVYIDRRYIPVMEIGQQEEVNLMIYNYKSEGHYEIQIMANLTDPEYKEVGTIFVNSAEMRSEGEELENKVSFARDLLSSNPECQELTELLNQAKIQLDKNNYVSTAKIVDDVINGCKYLVSNTNKIQEKPATDFIKSFQWNSKYQDYMIVAGFGLLFIISLIYLIKREKSEDF